MLASPLRLHLHLLLFSALFIVVSSDLEAIALNSPTAGYFTALQLGGPSDPVADNQANRPDIELVGRPESGLEAFYVRFDNSGGNSTTDGNWIFRIRVSGQNGKDDDVAKGFFYVGVDLTGDGSLDYMIEHGGQPNQNISILRAGAGSNSPSTVTLGASLYSTAVNSGPMGNSLFATVEGIDDLSALEGGSFDPYDLDGGGKQGDEDRFLTFRLDFQAFVDVVQADAVGEGSWLDTRFVDFDDSFNLQMLVVTSQNGNNINSDFGGIDDNSSNPSTPFVGENGNPGSGGLSGPVDPSGQQAVPEPSAFALLLGLFAVFCVSRRPQR